MDKHTALDTYNNAHEELRAAKEAYRKLLDSVHEEDWLVDETDAEWTLEDMDKAHKRVRDAYVKRNEAREVCAKLGV